MKRLFLTFFFTLCFSLVTHAAKLPEMQIFDNKEVFTKHIPIVDTLETVSPTGEPFLAKLLPKQMAKFSPRVGDYPWEAMGLGHLSNWTFTPGEIRISEYEQEIERLAHMVATRQGDFYSDQRFVLADLYLAVASDGNRTKLRKAYKSYRDALAEFPDSIYAKAARYNSALILLRLKLYNQCALYANQQEARYESDMRWAVLFRSLVMEAYYLRGRYVRAEDYLWQLANRISRDELTGHLSRRYGDSLFWQGKYSDMIAWYKDRTVRPYLDEKTQDAQLSRLYYGEALFQTGKPEESKAYYDEFIEKYQGDYEKRIIEYRLEQLKLMNHGNIEEAIPRFYALALREKLGFFKVMGQIQWARLVAKNDDSLLHTNAHAVIQTILKNERKLASPVKKEALLVKAYLEWRLGDRVAAYDTLERLMPLQHVQERVTPLIVAASDLATLLLLEDVPSYWEKNDIVGFLVKADRFGVAIEVSKYKFRALLWVGRAYMENGMINAGARLFQRMLFELDIREKTQVALELARAYGMMGETQLMGRALKLVKTIPADPRERELYYLTRAAYDISKERYDDCIYQFDSLLQKGVQGDELFKFAIQGAICARKAKRFEKAEKFLGLLGGQDVTIISQVDTEEIQVWQKESFYERVNLLAEKGDYRKAIDLFEQLKEKFLDFSPPLETVFLIVDSYRRKHEPDKALNLWEDYADVAGNIPTDFKKQFTRILETLGRLELVPDSH